MNKEKIRCQGLEKIYNRGLASECRALKGVDLLIKKGDFVSIMGHSGSGKSTLLNQLSCLDTPTSGKVFIEGTDISKLDDFGKAKLRREKLGFVFQQFNLIKSMTAFENIELPMDFEGVVESKRVKKVRELLEIVGLSDKEDNLPSQLSGGQQQRIAIARALVNNPDIILADEPTGNLDTATGKMVMELLTKLNREEGKTLIIVTHEANIAKMADRSITLVDGRIKSDIK